MLAPLFPFRKCEVGEASSLRRSRLRLESLVREEVSRLKDGRRCYLGGASQGCTMALDIYLRLANELKLGGFVGSVGFLPTESKGRPFLARKHGLPRLLWLQSSLAKAPGR